MTSDVEGQTNAKQQGGAPRRTVQVKVALGLSVLALLLSGVALAGWAQSEEERDKIESRLVCLELPGPNDCGQDGK